MINALYLSVICFHSMAYFCVRQGTELKLRAVYVNKDSILCPWAGVSGRYELRVSNDGVKVSGRIQMVVYNSLCEVCTLATCSPRVGL